MTAAIDAVRLQVSCSCGYEENEVDMSRNDLDRAVEDYCEECGETFTVEVSVVVS